MRKSWPILILVSILAAGCGSSDATKPDGSTATGGSAGGTGGSVSGTGGAAGADASASADASGDVPASQPDGGADVAGPTDAATTDTAQPDAAVVTDGPPGSMAVGPAGGTVTLSAGKVVIPPGALTQTVFILFRFVNTNFPNIPGNQAPASSVVSLEPHGQTFAKPVTLTLNHFAGSAPAALYTAQPGGTFTPVPGAVFTATTVEANLDHFSYFVVAPTVGGADAGADTLAPDASTPPDAAGPSTRMVKVRGETLSFDPEGLEINVGDTVTWVWEASGHSVVSGGKGGANAADCASDGKFASGVKNTAETFSFTFSTAGTYGYHCAAHCGQFEGGEIVVK